VSVSTVSTGMTLRELGQRDDRFHDRKGRVSEKGGRFLGRIIRGKKKSGSVEKGVAILQAPY